MRKPGTDEKNVQMSDVLCDYCHREWTEEIPLIEGHHGSCICGNCLTIAFTEVVLHAGDDMPVEFDCRMCLENAEARRELNRADEPGWRSPMHEDAFICRRCIKLAAGALHKDKNFTWQKPM